MNTCHYNGRTPMDLPMCLNCPLFLETCMPIATGNGFSNGECDCYLCETCSHSDCIHVFTSFMKQIKV